MAKATKKSASSFVTRSGKTLSVTLIKRLVKGGAVMANIAKHYGTTTTTIYAKLGASVKGLSPQGRRWTKAVAVKSLV